jgi:hypothetical protein
VPNSPTAPQSPTSPSKKDKGKKGEKAPPKEEKKAKKKKGGKKKGKKKAAEYVLSDKEKARRAEVARIYKMKLNTWGYSFWKNTGLYHIDFSNNELNEADLKLLIRAL